MKRYLHLLGSDLFNLIAPSLCPACDAPLAVSERLYCNACRSSLEPAPFPRDIFSEVAGNFPGDELALEAVGSLYRFDPDGPVQRLIHALKYHGCYRLGVEMGRELAVGLRMFRAFARIDLVVPVPLHKARERERGYNQAEAIAKGLAAAMPNVRMERALARRRHTISQTTLGAGARRANVINLFRATGISVKGRRILLCDDVCTTGATLNACAEQLLVAGAAAVLAATVAKDGTPL
ncbi:MAG: phosphoribosyltransferase family protein [Bacteroidota bacterium]